jgi:hypothetical protein
MLAGRGVALVEKALKLDEVFDGLMHGRTVVGLLDE